MPYDNVGSPQVWDKVLYYVQDPNQAKGMFHGCPAVVTVKGDERQRVSLAVFNPFTKQVEFYDNVKRDIKLGCWDTPHQG